MTRAGRIGERGAARRTGPRPLPLDPLRVASEYGRLDDVAWAAVYRASDEAKFVTGQVLSPNGGWYMKQSPEAAACSSS